MVVGAWHLFYQDLEARDNWGRTAVYLAAEIGDVAEVKELLAKGAEVDGRDDCRWTPLLRASQNGHQEVVEALISAGANVAALDKAGYSAVMVATLQNRATIVDLLLTQGAPLITQDKNLGWTALIWAAKEGYRESVVTLLAHGADPERKDFSGLDAIAWAKKNDHTALLPLLKSPRSS